jgi:hypothetical protein
MPLFDYKCLDCGKISEILVYHEKDEPADRGSGIRPAAVPSPVRRPAAREREAAAERVFDGVIDSEFSRYSGVEDKYVCMRERPFR